MKTICCVVLLVSGCALPGTPGVAQKDQCRVDGFGVRCAEVPHPPTAVLMESL